MTYHSSVPTSLLHGFTGARDRSYQGRVSHGHPAGVTFEDDVAELGKGTAHILLT
jgi:hypothetical protein